MDAANVDIRVRVTGGGHTSQIYAIRQAIAKSIVRASESSAIHETSPAQLSNPQETGCLLPKVRR